MEEEKVVEDEPEGLIPIYRYESKYKHKHVFGKDGSCYKCNELASKRKKYVKKKEFHGLCKDHNDSNGKGKPLDDKGKCSRCREYDKRKLKKKWLLDVFMIN